MDNIEENHEIGPEGQPELILTEAQKLKILEMIKLDPPPTVKDMGRAVFNKEIDAREQEGRIIRKFIKEKGLTFREAKTWIPKKVIELTEEQKVFISNNYTVMKPLEMSRTLFDNSVLTQLDSETRAIYSYIETLPKNINNTFKQEELNTEDYTPPRTEDQCLARIDKCVSSSVLDRKKLNEKQKRDIKNLIGYLNSIRFVNQINTFPLLADRKEFESQFIRCTYDKALTEEEVDQYIIYSTEVIIGKQILKRIGQFEEEQDASLEEYGKLSPPLVDAIKSLREEFNQCINRQQKLTKSLQGERNERIKTESLNKFSFSDLIVYWQKEENFQHLMKLKELRDKLLEDEINRIKSMDDIKAEVFGISPEELLN